MAWSSDETLTRGEQADEFLLMGLRLAEGIDPQRYAAFAGHPLDAARIAALGARGHGRGDAGRPPARHARGLSGARCGGGRSGGVTLRTPPVATSRPPPNAFGAGLTTCAPEAVTRITASAALVGAVGAEAEHAVDAGEARLVGQRLLGRSAPALASSPARRRATPRHRRASPGAADPVRSASDSGPRKRGNPDGSGAANQPPCAPGSAKMRGSSHSPVPISCMRACSRRPRPAPARPPRPSRRRPE